MTFSSVSYESCGEYTSGMDMDWRLCRGDKLVKEG